MATVRTEFLTLPTLRHSTYQYATHLPSPFRTHDGLCDVAVFELLRAAAIHRL